MRFTYIVLLIVAVSAVKFLDSNEPQYIETEETNYETQFSQPSTLFTADELAQNTEMSKENVEGFNFLDEQISPLGSADPSQVFLAASYEKDLPPSGNCVILYTECDFKGQSAKVCNSEEVMNYQLPVYSLYIPQGQQFTTRDQEKNEQMVFLTSDKCLQAPLFFGDQQADVFIAVVSQSLTGLDNLSDSESMAPQPQLLQQTQEQFDLSIQDEQSNEQINEQINEQQVPQEQINEEQVAQEQINEQQVSQEQIENTPTETTSQSVDQSSEQSQSNEQQQEQTQNVQEEQSNNASEQVEEIQSTTEQQNQEEQGQIIDPQPEIQSNDAQNSEVTPQVEVEQPQQIEESQQIESPQQVEQESQEEQQINQQESSEQQQPQELSEQQQQQQDSESNSNLESQQENQGEQEQQVAEPLVGQSQ